VLLAIVLHPDGSGVSLRVSLLTLHIGVNGGTSVARCLLFEILNFCLVDTDFDILMSFC
jgi:hypothetical protein